MRKLKKRYRSKIGYSAADVAELKVKAAGLPIYNSSYTGDWESYLNSFKMASNWVSLSMWGSIPQYQENADRHSIEPREEDFVKQPFRLLSSTIVGGGTWKATDFSRADVLKRSVNMLNGKTVYKDHVQAVDNWAGIVAGVKWSDSFTQDNGLIVPAGIDGILAIDAKTNPKLARGVKLGAIYSNSVTIEYEWEPSHDFENERDFFYRLGEMGSDGTMIRRIVTHILGYQETSLVSLGADPFAKAYVPKEGDEGDKLKDPHSSQIFAFSSKLKEEDVKNPYLAEKEEGKNAEKVNKYEKNLSYLTALEQNLLSLSYFENSKNRNNPKNFEKMDKKLLTAFLVTFGESLSLSQDLSVEQFEEALKNLVPKKEYNALQDKLDALEAKTEENKVTLTAVDGSKVELEAVEDGFSIVPKERFKQLKEDAAFGATGKAYSKQVREEVEKFYRIQNKEADEEIISLIQNGELKAVKALGKQYAKGLGSAFSATCKDCDSKNITFQQSKKQGKEAEDGEEVTELGTFDALYDRIAEIQKQQEQ